MLPAIRTFHHAVSFSFSHRCLLSIVTRLTVTQSSRTGRLRLELASRLLVQNVTTACYSTVLEAAFRRGNSVVLR